MGPPNIYGLVPLPLWGKHLFAHDILDTCKFTWWKTWPLVSMPTVAHNHSLINLCHWKLQQCRPRDLPLQVHPTLLTLLIPFPQYCHSSPQRQPTLLRYKSLRPTPPVVTPRLSFVCLPRMSLLHDTYPQPHHSPTTTRRAMRLMDNPFLITLSPIPPPAILVVHLDDFLIFPCFPPFFVSQ